MPRRQIYGLGHGSLAPLVRVFPLAYRVILKTRQIHDTNSRLVLPLTGSPKPYPVSTPGMPSAESGPLPHVRWFVKIYRFTTCVRNQQLMNGPDALLWCKTLLFGKRCPTIVQPDDRMLRKDRFSFGNFSDVAGTSV